MRRYDDWTAEVQRRLWLWSRWACGNHAHQAAGNPIAAMMRRAAGELPGDDCAIPRELTFELEVTEKAVARMKREHPLPRRLLIETYLKGRFVYELASMLNWSEKKTKAELWRAESIVGRYMTGIERELEERGIAPERKIV